MFVSAWLISQTDHQNITWSLGKQNIRFLFYYVVVRHYVKAKMLKAVKSYTQYRMITMHKYGSQNLVKT